jgi:hypothetical protein
MKKKNLKTLKLQKMSISNFGIKGGASPSAPSDCNCTIQLTDQLDDICCTITYGCPPSHIICPTEPQQPSKAHM